MTQQELYHYGVKGMKWHKHLKRHIDDIGFKEYEKLRTIKGAQKEQYTARDDEKMEASYYYRKKRNASGKKAEALEKTARKHMTKAQYHERAAQFMEHDLHVAQRKYDRTLLGKVSKGKAKVAEFLKKGFKK